MTRGAVSSNKPERNVCGSMIILHICLGLFIFGYQIIQISPDNKTAIKGGKKTSESTKNASSQKILVSLPTTDS